MHKFTTALAGLALAAAVGVAPAFAQAPAPATPGTFTFPGPGTFSFNVTPGSGFIPTTVIPVVFNPTAAGGTASTGTLTLAGGTEAFGATSVAGTYTGVTEFFAPNAGMSLAPFSDVGTVFISQRSATTFDIASDTTTFTASGTSFDLVPGVPAVPEASTTVSLGALLALGGLAVVLRRKGVQNAA